MNIVQSADLCYTLFMDIKQIKDSFIQGSEIYLKYLADNDLGIERIPVNDLIQRDGKVFFLHLSKKLYDSCGFEIEIKGVRYSEEDFDVKECNINAQTVTVEFYDHIKNIKAADIFILADMRFLVQRVIKWYKSFGDSVTFPEALPKISYNGYLSENIKPSACQEKAIRTIFSQPFSYIWGAPGTGKTKYVLANCLLNYLKNDDGIIFITAPTNAALDQTLSGILPVLEKENFDLSHIARLGIATESLSYTYPQVCEKEIIVRLVNEFNQKKEEILNCIKMKQEAAKEETSPLLKKKLDEFIKKAEKKYGEISVAEIERLGKELAGARENLFQYLIKNDIRIIACTVDKYIAFKMNKAMEKNERKASHLFLDEACYLSLVKAVTLLAMDCPVTFLGDHMQLPPVCEMDENCFNNPSFRPAVIWSQSAVYAEEVFEKSIEDIFEGFVANVPPRFEYTAKADLNETHRFGSGITEILENYVYENHFTSLAEDETNIVVIDAKGTSGSTRENLKEALAIDKAIKDFNLLDYMVLTPYKNQEALIKKYTDRVMTVHRAQGQEWDTVILSVCDRENMYFTDSMNKRSKGLELINTAISRAKKNLIVVCDVDFWKNCDGQLISALVNYYG